MSAEPATLSTAVGTDARVAGFPLFLGPQTAARSRRSADVIYPAAKRAFDIAVALMLLIALLPLLLVVALAVRLESPGPALYRGIRVGRFGRPFHVAKFRSMRAGCDSTPHAEFVRGLLKGTISCAVYKVPEDRRITRVGAFLRRTSIDELPQLWNVLRGDMSIVGPRPDVPYAVEEYADWIHRRLLVKPGITGLWQVSGRSRLSLVDMYRLDVDYVGSASLLGDVRILLRTVPAVLCRDGAA
jgi:lipopolysaccharide/colanic/teichoic acid biosynthesis glycosyltransferase